MWDLSVPWNFFALLFGVGAVLALYFSATNADREIAKAQARAAELEKEAAEARLKLGEIENLTAWRRLRVDQREELIQAIRDRLPPLIVIQYEQADPEAATFAIDLESAFKAAGGQDVRRSGNSIYIGGEPIFGLLYKAAPAFDSSVVKTAFAKVGYDLTDEPALPLPFGVGSPGQRMNPSDKRVIDLYLYVGHKPSAG
jgi:hypothetical protein